MKWKREIRLSNTLPVPKQVHVGYIGGILELLGNVMFFFSIFNFLMISNVYYNGSKIIQAFFPTFIHFFVAYCIFGLGLCIITWIYILPSRNKFAQTQAIADGRSPTYQKICELEEKVNYLTQLLDEKNKNGK